MSRSNPSAPGGLPRKNALTIAVGAALSGQNAADAQEAPEVRGLEEIIVTAQKRTENLQDLPLSIQAFSEEDMVRQGLHKFEDYVRAMPSVSFVSSGSGATQITFRGVASDAFGGSITDSSAALYLDEQPLTQFNIQVDPRLVDIERIESLSGPQGTLYGDSSQSGTLRIITNKPNPSKFEAFTDFAARDGSDSAASYDVSGMLNIPLVEDQFAIRLVGFSARDGGFVDNVLGNSPTLGPADTPARGNKTNADLVDDDINDVDFAGGRIAARWTPDESWAITAAAIFQNTEADGTSDYDECFDQNCTRNLGDLQTVKFFEEPRDDKWWQTGLTIEKTFGNFKFLSATAYFDRKIDYTVERTEYAAYFNFNFCSTYATYCWSGLSNGSITLIPGQGLDSTNPTPDDQDTTGFNTFNQDNHRFTQEFRISQEESRYRWIAGFFYEKKDQEWFYHAYTPEFASTLAYYYWVNLYSANASPVYAWWFSHDDVDWDQWAVFGDFTFDFNEQWSATVGGRYFDQESERVYEVDKLFISAPGVWPDRAPDTGKRKSDDNDFLPKVSLTYRFDEEKLVYLLYSEGFRAGGVNRNRAPTIFPEEYKADFLDNYEIGTKTRWLDGTLQVNATAFWMKWDDFQIEIVDPSNQSCNPPPPQPPPPPGELCGGPFQIIVGNVGNAEIKGVELSLRTIIGEGVDLGLDVTWLDAELDDDVIISEPVSKGSTLPGSPEWKASAFAQYTWPVEFVSGGSMYARLQYSYVDEMLNLLEPFPEEAPGILTTPQREMDSYGIADFSVGLMVEQWELQAFVNNFTDERAELYWNTVDHHTFWGLIILITNRPREYGLRFLYRWGQE